MHLCSICVSLLFHSLRLKCSREIDKTKIKSFVKMRSIFMMRLKRRCYFFFVLLPFTCYILIMLPFWRQTILFGGQNRNCYSNFKRKEKNSIMTMMWRLRARMHKTQTYTILIWNANLWTRNFITQSFCYFFFRVMFHNRHLRCGTEIFEGERLSERKKSDQQHGWL